MLLPRKRDISGYRSSALKPRPERGVGQGTFCMPRRRGSRSVFGSTPCFYFGVPAMGRQSNSTSGQSKRSAPPLPIDGDHWQAIVEVLELSPQQAKVVELTLRGMSDKEIATALGISEPTLRTYMSRISARTRTRGRMELAMRVLAVSHEVVH